MCAPFPLLAGFHVVVRALVKNEWFVLSHRQGSFGILIACMLSLPPSLSLSRSLSLSLALSLSLSLSLTFYLALYPSLSSSLSLSSLSLLLALSPLLLFLPPTSSLPSQVPRRWSCRYMDTSYDSFIWDTFARDMTLSPCISPTYVM